MAKQYSLEEIKKIVYSGGANASNITDIVSSLKDYDFNDEIREIFVGLSTSDTLPETIRINFKNFIDSYSEMTAESHQKIVASSNEESGGNSGANTEKIEEPQDFVFEEPVISTIAPVRAAGSDANYDDEEEISLANDAALGKLTAYATTKNIKIASSNPGVTGKPEISFELSYESKPYLDNLLLELYDNKDDINVEMARVDSTGQELLTIGIDNPELTERELQEKSMEMFNNINTILKSTDEEKDYESMMPDELRALKDKFMNDDPNIPDEDFKVGYSRKNGENTYYLVANSKEQALELAELMGYSVKKDRGGNVFELDTANRNMENTKLEKVTENINDIDEVKNTQDGISDVDINYNNKHYGDDEYQQIEEFINGAKDPDNMSVIQIDVPDATPNQRIVSLASEDGARQTIIFNDGKEFDNYTLPKIANAFGNGDTIDRDNATKTEYSNGKAGYDVLSSSNSYLRMNNFDSSTVDSVDSSLSGYMVESEQKENSSNTNKNTKAYSKTLGTYPTSNNNVEAAKTSFYTLLVFILVMAVGFGILYFMFGG